MNTIVYHIANDEKEYVLEEAAEIIRSGGLLAIPTETVYGLGADALNGKAVLKIFEAKGRPQDNPLLIHIPEAAWLEKYCEDIPPLAYRLAEEFWPGPLTMILKSRACIPSETTCGLETVGVRCPDNEVTAEIIRLAGVPVAAPSANRSGHPSCTSAEQVMEDFAGRIEGIVDEAVYRQLKEGEKPRAPGMKYRHYAPEAPMTAVLGGGLKTADYIKEHIKAGEGVICYEEYLDMFEGYECRSLGREGSPEEHAGKVFGVLRSFDKTAVTHIWTQCPREEGLDLAVSNRLKKAAGFCLINV